MIIKFDLCLFLYFYPNLVDEFIFLCKPLGLFYIVAYGLIYFEYFVNLAFFLDEYELFVDYFLDLYLLFKLIYLYLLFNYLILD